HARSAAHHHHHLVPCALETSEQQDSNEVPDGKGILGRVEAAIDVAGLPEVLAEPGFVGLLMQEASPGKVVENHWEGRHFEAPRLREQLDPDSAMLARMKILVRSALLAALMLPLPLVGCGKLFKSGGGSGASASASAAASPLAAGPLAFLQGFEG